MGEQMARSEEWRGGLRQLEEADEVGRVVNMRKQLDKANSAFERAGLRINPRPSSTPKQ
jgi:hypothetical protein